MISFELNDFPPPWLYAEAGRNLFYAKLNYFEANTLERLTLKMLSKNFGGAIIVTYFFCLFELYTKPNMLAAQNASVKATNRMFDQSSDPEALIYIAAADRLGKIAPNDKKDYNAFLRERLEIYREYMSRSYVTGRNLIETGIEPSERFSEYLDYAHRLRLAGVDKALR